MKVSVYIIGVLFLITNCVSQSKYEDLKKELDSYKDKEKNLSEELGASKQKEKALEDELDASKQKERNLEEELREKAKRTAELEASLSVTKDKNSQIEKAIGELKNQNSEKDEAIKKRDDEIRLALEEARKRNLETEKRLKEYKDLLSRFKSFMDSGNLKIKMVDGRIHVVMPSDILFASGQADLNESGLKTIKEVTKILVSIPEKKYQIEGHTDNVPIKTRHFPSNWELASARSLNVIKEMTKAGMPPERISGASFAEYKPVSPNTSGMGKALNRRIDIVILPDLSQLPGYEELQKINNTK